MYVNHDLSMHNVQALKSRGLTLQQLPKHGHPMEQTGVDLATAWAWVVAGSQVCQTIVRFVTELTCYTDRREAFPPREQLPLPTQPPYTAHLANLSFDVTQGEIEEFFRECQVTSVRIVEDKMGGKPKGFGYVEFGNLEGLKKALDLSGRDLTGRSVRISVAEPRKSTFVFVLFPETNFSKPKNDRIREIIVTGHAKDLSQTYQAHNEGYPTAILAIAALTTCLMPEVREEADVALKQAMAK